MEASEDGTAGQPSSSPILLAITLAVTLFTLAPMVLSVTAGLINNYSVGIRSGFTTRWLLEVWSVYGNTVWRSLLLAACCVVGTLVLGVPAAYALARSRSRWMRLFEKLLTLPVAVPGLATALALLAEALAPAESREVETVA